MSEENQVASYLAEIKSMLDGLASDASDHKGWSNTQWTLGIKLGLVNIGKNNFGMYTCASGAETGNSNCGEWLFDVSWIDADKKYNDRYSGLKSLELAAESEWGSWRDVEHDFEKLMVSRAKLRLIIFDNVGEQKKNIEKCLQKLEHKLKNFNSGESSDCYLAAIYQCRDEKTGSKLNYENGVRKFLYRQWQEGTWQSV